MIRLFRQPAPPTLDIPADAGARAGLVRAIKDLAQKCEGDCVHLAQTFYKAQSAVVAEREALAKAEFAMANAQAAWSGRSRITDYEIATCEAELVATASPAIDVVLREIDGMKRRFGGNSGPQLDERRIDGNWAPSALSIAEHNHSQRRWQTFLDGEAELRAMKLRADEPVDLEKALADVRARVNASLYFETPSH